jgi:hypothetical protein
MSTQKKQMKNFTLKKLGDLSVGLEASNRPSKFFIGVNFSKMCCKKYSFFLYGHRKWVRIVAVITWSQIRKHGPRSGSIKSMDQVPLPFLLKNKSRY